MEVRWPWRHSTTGRLMTLGCACISWLALASSCPRPPGRRGAACTRWFPAGSPALPNHGGQPVGQALRRGALLPEIVEGVVKPLPSEPGARLFDCVAVRDSVQSDEGCLHGRHHPLSDNWPRMQTKIHTLEGWLRHCERLHPQNIDMGLERVREVATRMGLRFDCPVISSANLMARALPAPCWRPWPSRPVFTYQGSTHSCLVHFEERCRVRKAKCF